MKALDLFKIQGFKTPEETFFLGYLMALGGEQYFMDQVDHDIELLTEANPEFWAQIVKDSQDIRNKVIEENIREVILQIVSLLKERNARIPTWIKEKMKKYGKD